MVKNYRTSVVSRSKILEVCVPLKILGTVHKLLTIGERKIKGRVFLHQLFLINRQFDGLITGIKE